MSTVCKLLLIVTLIGFSYYLFAKGGRYFRSTGSNYRNTKPLITKETWKPIVAGGAAAGILVAAYKVSDGIADGLRTVAKDDPSTFMVGTQLLSLPVILLIILCVIIAVSLMCRRYPWDFFKKGKQNENQQV